MATTAQRYGLAKVGQTQRQTRKVVTETFSVSVTDGASAGTFNLPADVKVLNYHFETAAAIPGTPTTTNIRLGSGANGQQYVADVDVKAQGWVTATVVYAGRNPASTIHYTVASSGGTAASQDGTILIHVEYVI